MKPQQIDVDDALAQMRVLSEKVFDAAAQGEDANLSFINMQRRLYPVREAMYRFILDEFNRGESGTDIMLATCSELASCLAILQNDCVATDVLIDSPPPNFDMTKYSRYKPSIEHAMLHITIDLIESCMHDRLYSKIENGPLADGVLSDRGGHVHTQITPKPLKMN